jgi:hypothetical protein
MKKPLKLLGLSQKIQAHEIIIPDNTREINAAEGAAGEWQ